MTSVVGVKGHKAEERCRGGGGGGMQILWDVQVAMAALTAARGWVQSAGRTCRSNAETRSEAADVHARSRTGLSPGFVFPAWPASQLATDQAASSSPCQTPAIR